MGWSATPPSADGPALRLWAALVAVVTVPGMIALVAGIDGTPGRDTGVAVAATPSTPAADSGARDSTARDSTARDSTARDSTTWDSGARDLTVRDGNAAASPGTAAEPSPVAVPPAAVTPSGAPAFTQAAAAALPKPAAAAATTPSAGAFTLAATGDLLVHTPVRTAAATAGGFDFTPLLAAVAPAIQAADVALCHLETPLTSNDADLSSYPVFNVPDELASAIATTGWDVCSTASNHAVDRGFGGIRATLDALDAAGVAHAGTARSQEEADRSTLVDAGGVTVGFVSATYGLNGLPLPAAQPWSVQLIDVDQIRTRAVRARQDGARFVVVSLHWGSEYQQAPTTAQTALASQLLADPAIDLLIGHHAHVVQPVGRVGGKVVAYGLGNFLSGQQRGSTRDGVILQVSVTSTASGFAVKGVSWLPTLVQAGSYAVVPAPPDSAARTDQALRALGETPTASPPR